MIEVIIIIFSIIALIGCIITCFTKVENVNRVATIVAIISLLITVIFSVLTYNLNQNELEEYKNKNKELEDACAEKDEEIKNLNKTILDKDATIQKLKQDEDKPKDEDISINSDGSETSEEDSVLDFADISNILYSGVEYEKFDGMNEDRFTVGEMSIGLALQYGMTVVYFQLKGLDMFYLIWIKNTAK